ncbi:MAG: hypothetical protein ABWZ52_06970 [Acidimicrobiales bacterium]
MPSYGIETGTGLATLYGWLARPHDPERTTAALLGLPMSTARHLVGTVLATSDEAEDLLHAMPTIVRSLAVATTDRPERCVGEIRGPVLWAETMSARSASAGDPGLFVCATTTKAYDTDENRVLKSALAAIHRAGRRAEQVLEGESDEVVKRARHNGQHAGHLLEHQTLALVPVVRPSGRMLRRTRAGSRRHTYRPALALLRRAGDPLLADQLGGFADERTRAQHDLLAATLLRIEDITGTSPVLRTDEGGLVAGPLRFHHPGRRDPDHVDGITIGNVLLDVPDPLHGDAGPARANLVSRAGTRRAVLAEGAPDVEEAVSLGLG